MLIVMTSPDALLKNGKPDAELANVLVKARAANNPVGVISNHDEPPWFKVVFGSSGVQFVKNRGRQSGEIVSANAKSFSLKPFDVLVLAAKDEDVQMGKNGGAVLIAAGWSSTPQVTSLGIRVNDHTEFQEMINLSAGWSGKWWFAADGAKYGVRALSDLSSFGKSTTQQDFGHRLTQTVKNGGSRLNALLAVTARSLLMDGIGSKAGLVWGVYPSSSSKNDDTEILSDFTHRLRTTVSRVRFSKRGVPLFIRHKPSTKRSKGGGGDRTDPTEQLETVHLNPFYEGRLSGRHVIVLDDCTTYGVSFGVAAALLRKAGATAVTGVALGKFGDQLRYYEIDVKTDPFKPITSGGFSFPAAGFFLGELSPVSQKVLQKLIP